MRSALSLLLLALGLCGSSVHAQSNEVERIRSVMDAAIDAIYGECCKELSTAEKQTRVRAVLETEYDMDVVIRRAIGRNWSLMTPEEQTRVLELIKQLVVRAYVEGLQGRERPSYELGEVVPVTDKRMEIPCTIEFNGKPIYLLYRLGKMKSGWEIYDIVVEDISVVSNYRQQIDDHFRKGNAQDLIRKLEELLTKEDLNDEILL